LIGYAGEPGQALLMLMTPYETVRRRNV
jgi:hypothetical protein